MGKKQLMSRQTECSALIPPPVLEESRTGSTASPVTNEVGVFFSKLVSSLAMRLASVYGGKTVSSAKVFLNRHNLDMGRIDAMPYPAQVVTLLSSGIGQYANKYLIDQAMSPISDAVVATTEHPVTVPINRSLPFPTARSGMNDNVFENISKEFPVYRESANIGVSHRGFTSHVKCLSVRLGLALVAPFRAVSIISNNHMRSNILEVSCG